MDIPLVTSGLIRQVSLTVFRHDWFDVQNDDRHITHRKGIGQ